MCDRTAPLSFLWDSCLVHNVIPQNIIILYNILREMFSPNAANKYLPPCHGSYQWDNYFRFVCFKKKVFSCSLFTRKGQLMWQIPTNIWHTFLLGLKDELTGPQSLRSLWHQTPMHVKCWKMISLNILTQTLYWDDVCVLLVKCQQLYKII